MSAPIGRPAATCPSTGRCRALSLDGCNWSPGWTWAGGTSTRMPRARPGTRPMAPAASSASRWYCAARTPLKPKARAISACDGGTPSASMRSAIRPRMACWVSVRFMVSSNTTNWGLGQLPRGRGGLTDRALDSASPGHRIAAEAAPTWGAQGRRVAGLPAAAPDGEQDPHAANGGADEADGAEDAQAGAGHPAGAVEHDRGPHDQCGRDHAHGEPA